MQKNDPDMATKVEELLTFVMTDDKVSPKEPVRIAITGGAGQIGYALAFRAAAGEMLGRDQRVHLSLIEREEAIPALKGVAMELADCAFPLLSDVTITSNAEEGFDGAKAALLVGSSPRAAGMERADLLRKNAEIFVHQGKALNKFADDSCKVVVVGNPANTNALITAHHAPKLEDNISALMLLDHNRSLSMLADKLKTTTSAFDRFVVWGNHSPTMVPDVSYCSVNNGQMVTDLVDETWVSEVFRPLVQQRGSAIIAARNASSAASAANATLAHMKSWMSDSDGQWISMARMSKGEYGVQPGLFFSMPTVIEEAEAHTVMGLYIDDPVMELFEKSEVELRQERDAVHEYL